MHDNDEIRPRASQALALASFNPPLRAWTIDDQRQDGIAGPFRVLAVALLTTTLSYRPGLWRTKKYGDQRTEILTDPAGDFDCTTSDVETGSAETHFLVVDSPRINPWLSYREVFFSEDEAIAARNALKAKGGAA